MAKMAWLFNYAAPIVDNYDRSHVAKWLQINHPELVIQDLFWTEEGYFIRFVKDGGVLQGYLKIRDMTFEEAVEVVTDARA